MVSIWVLYFTHHTTDEAATTRGVVVHKFHGADKLQSCENNESKYYEDQQGFIIIISPPRTLG